MTEAKLYRLMRKVESAEITMAEATRLAGRGINRASLSYTFWRLHLKQIRKTQKR